MGNAEGAPKALKARNYTASDSESESDHKSSKEAAKQKAKPKKPSINSDSDSDAGDKPTKSGKKKPKAAKPKQPDPELKEDEEEKLTGSDGEEKEKYKKVPCNMCGRQMANEFVLQYHLVRCPGAKKRQSVDSPAAAAGDHERKKAKKDLVETEKSKSSVGGKKGGEDVKKIDNPKWWG